MSVPFSDAWIWKLKVVVGLNRSAAGVNFNPGAPCAAVIKSPLLICVVPLFRNNVPFVMPVILKLVISAPSTAFLVITRPEVVCTSSLVVAGVTDGVSGTGVTFMLTVASPLPLGSGAPLVVPSSMIVYLKLAGP